MKEFMIILVSNYFGVKSLKGLYVVYRFGISSYLNFGQHLIHSYEFKYSFTETLLLNFFISITKLNA